MNNQNNKEQDKFEPMGTKIDPAMAVVWNAVCQALGTDTYHLLQQFIYAMIRMASDAHAKTPEVEKLMTLLDSDAAWQNAINLCAPKGKLSISQMILIVEDEEKEGFAMTMLNKPFFNDCLQIDNANMIIERVLEVGFKRIYKKIREMGKRHECKWFADTLLLMLDAQDILEIEESEREEMIGKAMFNDYGRPIEYGKKTKGYKHRTPDSLDRQHRIIFEDFDHDTGDDMASDVERAVGGKPFGEEP